MEQTGRKIKLSQNPAQAFLQGVKEGEKRINAEYIHQGLNLAYEYMLLSMADANDRSDQDKRLHLSKPQFAEFYLKFAKAFWTRINECIEGEPGIDTYDIADLHWAHDRDIREYYGLPLREDEVL